MAPSVVQMRTAAETALIERFEAEKAGLPGAAAERAAAFERFKVKGLPSKRVEAYHYTDLRALMRQAPEAILPPNTYLMPSDRICIEAIPTISFGNGKMQLAQDIALPISVRAIDDALESGSVTLNSAFVKLNDPVVDLNTIFCRDGALLEVPGGSKLSVHLAFVDDLDELDTKETFSVSSRVIINVGAGAELLVYESHEGSQRSRYQSNHVVELILGEGAKVEHIRVNTAGNEALVLSTLAASLAAEAELMSLNFSMGGAVARHQSFITYAGENAKLDLRGATMIRGRQHCDNTLVVDHAVPHGTSRELFRTVADDEAHGVFQGKIIVRPHAQKTDGQMASNALLLGDEAAMSNKPELEIFADDVVCAHGATCGALEESQLFYLMARGLPRVEAEALLVEAFLGEVLEAVSDETLRDSLAMLISEWLAARQAA